MSKEQIEKAIMVFWDLPLRTDGFQDGRPNQHAGHAELAKALAEHLAAVLPPTFDEVVAAMKKHNEQQKLQFAVLTVFDHGGGAVRDGSRMLFHWPNSDNPGKTAIAAIEAAMKPEPTAKEKALVALRDIEEAPCSLGPRIAIIRETLEAE